MSKEEFFDSYEEAVDAMSECDAVLTTAGEWDGGTEFIGKFAPANEIGGKYFDASGVEFWMDSDSGWVIAESWTICNNTKPLKDLTDKQAAELFNAWRKNQDILELVGDQWCYVKPMQLSLNGIYRIKPKSERELFVEACVSKIKSHNSDDPSYYNGWFEQLFEAGCRFND